MDARLAGSYRAASTDLRFGPGGAESGFLIGCFTMDEPKNDLDRVAVTCAACDGKRVIRGPKTSIIWFDCGYCAGSGQTSQGRFQYWYDHHFRERSDLFETTF